MCRPGHDSYTCSNGSRPSCLSGCRRIRTSLPRRPGEELLAGPPRNVAARERVYGVPVGHQTANGGDVLGTLDFGDDRISAG